MERTFELLILIFLTISISCKSQNKLTELQIKDFKFESIFGNKKGENNKTTYTNTGHNKELP